MRKHPKISAETEIKIIEYFKKNDDNRSIHIAKVFGVQVHQTEKIINDFLKPKINNLKIY
jgi:hypothetical protein